MTTHICDAGHPGCFYLHENIARSHAFYTALVVELRAQLPGVVVELIDNDRAGFAVEIELSTGRAFSAGNVDDSFAVNVLDTFPGVCSRETDICDYESATGRHYRLSDAYAESELTDESPARDVASFIARFVELHI